MKLLVIAATLLVAAVPAHAKKKSKSSGDETPAPCVKLAVNGAKCTDASIDLSLERCEDSITHEKPKVECKSDTGLITFQSKKYEYKAKIRNYVGQLGNSVWVLDGEATRAPRRKVAQAEPAQKMEVTEVVKKADCKVEFKTEAKPVEPSPAPVAAAPTPKEAGVFNASGKFGALVQFWYVDDSTQASQANSSTFRVRRAEVKFSGNPTEDTSWFIVTDFAKTPGATSTTDQKVLQDAGVTFKLVPGLELTMGQIKQQTVSESAEATSALLFAERSLISRTYGEVRDAGALLSYKNDFFKLNLMSSNGQGTNQEDRNNVKDFSSRFEAYLPWGITWGAFAFAKGDVFKDLEKYGTNVAFSSSNLLLKAEMANGFNGIVRSQGLVFDGAYKFTDNWQLASRYESVQPDTDADYKGSAATVGINYYHAKNAMKVQLNHSQLFNLTGPKGTTSLSPGQRGSLILLGVQTQF